TVTDDEDYGYEVGSTWVNTVSGEVFSCTDATAGAAVWSLLNRKNVVGSVSTMGLTDNVSVFGDPYYQSGVSGKLYVYNFYEVTTNLFLRGGVTFIPDGLGGYNYVVNN